MATVLTAIGWENPAGVLQGVWTNQSDVVEDLRDGIGIAPKVTVNTLAGNDVIQAESVAGSPGIFNQGLFFTGAGHDVITGRSFAEDKAGLINEGKIYTGTGNDVISAASDDFTGTSLVNRGILNTGTGNDRIIATAGHGTNAIANVGCIAMGEGNDVLMGSGYGGIANDGVIDTGTGHDQVLGDAGEDIGGIYNRGMLLTHDGHDVIQGSGDETEAGIYNEGIIVTGRGNDSISGFVSYPYLGILNSSHARIDTGEGHDSIVGGYKGFQGRGIENAGLIKMGAGNDTLTGLGNGGILNNGTIDMGDGNDQVFADDFAGNGKLFLRAGNDRLSGFGSGYFYGGTGWDTLTLGVGEYTVGRQHGCVTFTQDGITMKTAEFELLRIGSETYCFNDLRSGDIVG